MLVNLYNNKEVRKSSRSIINQEENISLSILNLIDWKKNKAINLEKD